MSQECYDQWVRNTPANYQDKLCGGNQISQNEMYFINTYGKSVILDIGCGTGHRTFPEWKRRGLDFYGIEKFNNLIVESEYRDRIIQADIGDPGFLDSIATIRNIEIAYLFGGVINGFIATDIRENAWKNFRLLLDKCNYILIDTLTHFPWYHVYASGMEVQLFNNAPIQYFYSEQEIKKLNNMHELEVCEQINEQIGQLQRTHYLLKKKK